MRRGCAATQRKRMWEQIIAVATSVYAAASILLLLTVFISFRQLRVLGRSQQVGVLEHFMGEYRTKDMLEHITAFVRWANTHRDNAPFVYAMMHAKEDPAFMELHNHRRQISQLLGRLGASAEIGLYSLDFAVRVAGSAARDVRYLLGVEWRLCKQLDERDGIFSGETFQRWGVVELFIASCAIRERSRYGPFQKKTWWTPFKLWQWWKEGQFRERDLLPRYRSFLNELAKEQGYEEWARAALEAFDRPLSLEEQLGDGKQADDGAEVQPGA